LEIRIGVLIDGIDETSPLLALHSIDGLLLVDGAAHDDVVREPLFYAP